MRNFNLKGFEDNIAKVPCDTDEILLRGVFQYYVEFFEGILPVYNLVSSK